MCRFVRKGIFSLVEVGLLDSRSMAINSLHERLLGLHPDQGFRAGTVTFCRWTMRTTAALRLRDMIKDTQVPCGPQHCTILYPAIWVDPRAAEFLGVLVQDRPPKSRPRGVLGELSLEVQADSTHLYLRASLLAPSPFPVRTSS